MHNVIEGKAEDATALYKEGSKPCPASTCGLVTSSVSQEAVPSTGTPSFHGLSGSARTRWKPPRC